MENQVFIDLDGEQTIPKLTVFQGLVNIKKGGRIVVRNSVLEDIDIFSKEELSDILKRTKEFISPVVTSRYIPLPETMRILTELAPDFQVRIKTEKPGGTPIIPISCEEYWEGEKIFSQILKGLDSNWTEKQKAKYLYNQTGQMLSYDLNVLNYTPNSSLHEKYARNIFTAIHKNWGICSAFASIFDYLCFRANIESMVLSEEEHDYTMITIDQQEDYLADPTFDSMALKFGMKTKYFGVSKKFFQENGHHLEETEAAEFGFDEIEPEEIEELDQVTGYLERFGGTYTDEELSNIANYLNGENIKEKTLDFLDRVKKIKFIGRPTTYDFEELLNWILAKSEDKDFVKSIRIQNYLLNHSKELSRKLVLEMTDEKGKEFFAFEDNLIARACEKVIVIEDDENER